MRDLALEAGVSITGVCFTECFWADLPAQFPRLQNGHSCGPSCHEAAARPQVHGPAPHGPRFSFPAPTPELCVSLLLV